MNLDSYLSYWANLYKEDMLNDIMPFWMEHGLDKTHGGVYTCVDRKGELMDSTKSVWFQGRFAFTCCFAYNHIEQKQGNGWTQRKVHSTSSRLIVLTKTEECISK